MSNNLIEKFGYLPDEIIHKIINYTNVVVYRNGKYIDRINKSDERYRLVKNIPRPIKIGKDRVLLKLLNYVDDLGYLIEYRIKDYKTADIKFVWREMDGFDRYLNVKTYDTYLFDCNSKWSKIISYIM